MQTDTILKKFSSGTSAIAVSLKFKASHDDPGAGHPVHTLFCKKDHRDHSSITKLASFDWESSHCYVSFVAVSFESNSMHQSPWTSTNFQQLNYKISGFWSDGCSTRGERVKSIFQEKLSNKLSKFINDEFSVLKLSIYTQLINTTIEKKCSIHLRRYDLHHHCANNRWAKFIIQ